MAVIREEDALAKLPEAQRKEWQALWEEVEAQSKRAQEKAPWTSEPSLGKSGGRRGVA